MKWPWRRSARIVLDMEEVPAAKGSRDAFEIAFEIRVSGAENETVARQVTIAAFTEYLRQNAPERLIALLRDPQ